MDNFVKELDELITLQEKATTVLYKGIVNAISEYCSAKNLTHIEFFDGIRPYFYDEEDCVVKTVYAARVDPDEGWLSITVIEPEMWEKAERMGEEVWFMPADYGIIDYHSFANSISNFIYIEEHKND